MIAAVVVCPHPPLLFRELSGEQDVAADLRQACLDASRTLLDADLDLDSVVVVGGADTSREWSCDEAFDVTRYGTTRERPADVAALPLSLGLAKLLLDDAGWDGSRELYAVSWSAPAQELAGLAARLSATPGRTGLLVMAEGSARRTRTAPGYLDDRAPELDHELGRALRECDAAALANLDTDLAEQLMVMGRSSFQVLGRAAASEHASARVLYEHAPFGVMYFVATWRL